MFGKIHFVEMDCTLREFRFNIILFLARGEVGVRFMINEGCYLYLRVKEPCSRWDQMW